MSHKRSLLQIALLLSAFFLCPNRIIAQAPVSDPAFESTTHYGGGIVDFTAQPGFLHRLWYHNGVSIDQNGGGTLLWELLPEQVYGAGQTVAWRLHGDLAPPPGGPVTPPPATPITVRSYQLRAYNDGGTLIQWWSEPLQRMQRAYKSGLVSPNFDLKKPGNPPPMGFHVFSGIAMWTDELKVGGVTTARIYWSVSCFPGRGLPELLVDDFDPSEQPVLDAIMANYATVKAKLSAGTPPVLPAPPPPPGITLFGDHDPQQTNRRRGLYKVERLEVDSDFDGVPDHTELADPDANPYDIMNHAFAGFPLSAVNAIPNAYESLSNVANGIVLNEVSLTGNGVLEDEDGSEPDWIELFNPTNAAINVSGWQLRDSGNADNWFTFPAADARCLIPSGGYLLVLCRNGAAGGPFLRTNFQLSAGNGEQVELHRPDPANPGNFILQDFFAAGATPRYGPIPGGNEHSFGRAMWSLHPNGASALTFGYFETPTPGAMNSGLWYEGFCNPVTGVTVTNTTTGVGVQSGVNSRAFGHRFGASITGGDPANSVFVHYTLNGALPTPWSAVADANTGALDLSPDTPFDINDVASMTAGRGFVVRARAFKAGFVSGPLVTRNFLFKEDVFGRADNPASPNVNESEPRQERPAGYPELSLPENSTSFTMRYGVQPSWGSVADLTAVSTQFTAAPSIAITLPVADSFDRDSGGIIASALATETGVVDPQLNNWERQASMQWIIENPTGQDPPLETLCGLDVSGRTSLSYGQTLKKGFRLSFRKRYGAGKFAPNLQVLSGAAAADEYNELVLRGQTGDSWTSAQGSWYPSHASYSRERWARTFMEQAGHFSLKSRHIHVWVNGLYWGTYMLSEVATDETLDTRIRPADWQIWKDEGAVVEAPASAGGTAGASAAWLALTQNAAEMATAVQLGDTATANARWATLQTLMDVDNFCDYAVINGYMGNWDSMWNNGRMYRDPAPNPNVPGQDSRIRWIVYDCEMGCNPDYLKYGWAQPGQLGPWQQNTTTNEWRRYGWMGRTADWERCGIRGMIVANTTAGSNAVTFPKQVTANFYGPGSAFRIIGQGIPAGATVTGVVTGPGLTTITLNQNATATQSGVNLVHFAATTSAGALLRDLAYHSGFARRLSARVHRHFYDQRPGKLGQLSANVLEDRAVTSYQARSNEFAPFKPCEYLRWGAGYSSNGGQPTNSWLPIQPDYTTQTYLPQRRAFFTQELQMHPFPAGAQPGPNPQSLYLPLEAPLLTTVAPGDPLPPGWSAVKLDPRSSGQGAVNPQGTIVRYTLNGGDPSTVEFPLYSQGQINIGGVYFGGQPDWINVPNGTVLRARTAIVDLRTSAPPQDSDSIVERIITESPAITVFTPP